MEKLMSLSEQRALEIVANSIFIDDKKRIHVRSPWREGGPNFICNVDDVVRSTTRLERKLKLHQPHAHKKASEELREWLELGFVRVLDPEIDAIRFGYFLDWLLVTRKDKPSMPVRPVFDGSREHHGKSLNDALLSGPKLQKDIFYILLNARKHPILLISDISKMFLQFGLHQEDRKYHRFYWQEKYYEANSVLFGTTSAPFMAAFGVRYLADLHKETYPLAHKILNESLYVDDVCASLPSLDEAREAVRQLKELGELGSLPFRKWGSSHPEVLAEVPDDCRLTGLSLESEGDPVTKALGMYLDTVADQIVFKAPSYEPYENQPLTLRIMSKYTPSLYDPLGLLDPVTVVPKLLIQRVVALRPIYKIDWDTCLEMFESRELNDVMEKWKTYVADLLRLEVIRIPRPFSRRSGSDNEIHLFTDASEAAHAAVSYYVSKELGGRTLSTIMCSRKKLASLSENCSMPEKELTSCVIGSRLLDSVRAEFNEVKRFYIWTDSSTALTWISKPAHAWKGWVARRVTDIYQKTKSNTWRHVPGKLNPSDKPTRGLTVTELSECDLWVEGPPFLQLDECEWPEMKIEVSDDDLAFDYLKIQADKLTREQVKRAAMKKAKKVFPGDFKQGEITPRVVNFLETVEAHRVETTLVLHGCLTQEESRISAEHVVTALAIGMNFVPQHLLPAEYVKDIWAKSDNDCPLDLKRFSKYGRAVRVFAYALRFVKRTREKIRSWPRTELSEAELYIAEMRLAVYFQRKAFKGDLDYLHSRREWKKGSKLAPLDPTIGPHGELRHKGRLMAAKASWIGKMNLILPHSTLGKLYLQELHLKMGHGLSRTQYLVKAQETVWMASARRTMDSILKKVFKVCEKETCRVTPHMGPLPAHAIPLTELLPFKYCSMDLAGPFYLRCRRSLVERHILIIVCLHVKAVHTEVLEELTADALWRGLERFVARRGCPKHIRSDHGTNFRGAADPGYHRFVSKMLSLDWDRLRRSATSIGVLSWTFSPPRAPHFNGAAEAAVKSWKKALSRVFDKSEATIEEFITAVVKSEALVNSRPLGMVEDYYITPSHFLTSGPPGQLVPSIPVEEVVDHPGCLAQRDKHVQGLWEVFAEVLSLELRRMAKWQNHRRNLQENDVVAVLDKKYFLKRDEWPLGIIEKVKEGNDGIVHRAWVRVVDPSNGTPKCFDRGAQWLVPLDWIADQPALDHFLAAGPNDDKQPLGLEDDLLSSDSGWSRLREIANSLEVTSQLSNQ